MLGRSYVTTETFRTNVLNGHEVLGVWSEHASVELDPGNEFKIINKPEEDSHWFTAEMNHNLWYQSNERPGTAVPWKGQFYIREDFHRKYVKESR
jgi:hypothetical protein|tara:strand:+ start:4583 stop:4867 length:285 start_codon:yes stop_codon:yes gene_type:complete